MLKRQSLIVANWKMNGSLDSIRRLVGAIVPGIKDVPGEVLICPPFVYIAELVKLLEKTTIRLGAQNVSQMESGAFTGEIAPPMLKDLACEYVIVGHSERRMLYNESATQIARKFVAVQASGIIPILCVGELLEDRNARGTEAVIAKQLDTVIEVAGIKAFRQAVIAYEPVWAIGTGKTALPEQAQEVHEFIRLRLARHDHKTADSVRIIYGGSIKADNAEQLFELADVDGGLIGGASLVAKEFLAICHSVR